MTTCIVVFALQHAKFYVAETQDPEKLLEELREGLGPVWTRVHRPISIMKRTPFQRKEDLDGAVKEMFKEKGIESTRGGSWSDLRLSDADRHKLHAELHGEEGCVIA